MMAGDIGRPEFATEQGFPGRVGCLEIGFRIESAQQVRAHLPRTAAHMRALNHLVFKFVIQSPRADFGLGSPFNKSLGRQPQLMLPRIALPQFQQLHDLFRHQAQKRPLLLVQIARHIIQHAYRAER